MLKSFLVPFQVWFQNRRAKFRKQERLAQQKVSNSSSVNDSIAQHVKSENKSGPAKEKPPGSPLSNVSTTPTDASSNSDIKPIGN